MDTSIVRLIAFFLPLFLWVGCNRNCQDLVRGPSSDLTIANRINQGSLENGLHYFYMKNEKPQGRCFLRLNVAVGSFFEEDQERGMAHLVEHLAFEDRIVSADESLAEWFQKHGMAFGPDANAYTTSENTIYKIDLPTCTKEAVNDALRLFHSFAQGLLFDEKGIAKEKNIIDAEEREYKNAQGELTEKIMNNLYSGTLYVSRPVLGDKQVRERFTQEMIKNFYKKWYYPKNLSVVVVGDFKDLPIGTMIKDAFADLKQSEQPGQRPDYPAPDFKSPVFIIKDKEYAHVETVFTIQAKKIVKPVFKKALLKERLAFDLALAMLANAYDSYARGKSDSLRQASISGFMYDHGVYELSLTSAEKPQLQEQTFKEAYLYLRQKAALGFDAQEFSAIRDAQIDAIRQWLEEEPTWDSNRWAENIVSYIGKKSFPNSAADFHQWIRPILSQMSAKDCQDALNKAMNSGNHYVFAIGAIEETDENKKKLAEVFAEANQQKFQAQKPKDAISFKYTTEACSKTVLASEKNLTPIGAEIVSYPNNLTLVLKKTDFKKDEIRVEVFTDEGFSTMNNRDLVISRVAQAVLLQGGLGKHPPEEIPALFLDKYVHAGFHVMDNRVHASIATRNQDLRFVLSYIYALITDPMYSDVTISRVKEATMVQYQTLKHNILEPLQDDFSRALTKNDFRVGRVPLAELLSVSREELIAWHQKYLSHKPLRFVIVGDIDLERVKTDVGCIFSSYPKTNNTVSKKASLLSYYPGIHKTYEVQTKDETSKVVVHYPLMFPSDKYPDHRLRILQDLLQETLRLKLREKRQATYGATVTVQDGKEPFAQNFLEIFLSVKKSDAARIKNDIIKILDSLAIKGIRDQNLVKAKEPYLTQAANLVSQNNYWSSVIANNFSTVNSLAWVTTLSKDITAIKASDINPLLKTYLQKKNASSAIVHAVD